MAIIFPNGMYKQHIVKNPRKMKANLDWFEAQFKRVGEGSILQTDYGAYKKVATGWEKHKPVVSISPRELGLRDGESIIWTFK